MDPEMIRIMGAVIILGGVAGFALGGRYARGMRDATGVANSAASLVSKMRPPAKAASGLPTAPPPSPPPPKSK